MTLLRAVTKTCYTEAEAARWLGITLARLHELLDEHIFNDGSLRPPRIEFNASDLLLLAYWENEHPPDRDRAHKDNVVPIKSCR